MRKKTKHSYTTQQKEEVLPNRLTNRDLLYGKELGYFLEFSKHGDALDDQDNTINKAKSTLI